MTATGGDDAQGKVCGKVCGKACGEKCGQGVWLPQQLRLTLPLPASTPISCFNALADSTNLPCARVARARDEPKRNCLSLLVPRDI
jgi:hypothetical protein